MNIGEWLAFRYHFSPEKCAFYDCLQKRSYTYRMLFERTALLSNYLFRTRKVNKSERVAILSENRIETMEVLFASAKIGAIMVPLHTELPDEEIARYVSHAAPVLLFYSRRFRKTVEHLRELKAAGSFVELDDEGAHRYEEKPSFSHPVEEVEVSHDDPLAIVYNFEESREIRGVIVSQGMALWNSINANIGFRLGESDCAPLFSPLWSAEGLFMFTLPLIHAGGTTVLPEGTTPGDVEKIVREGRCTFLPMKPGLWEELASNPLCETLDLAGLRFCISSGLCAPEMVVMFQEKKTMFFREYVLPEAGPHNFLMPGGRSFERPDSIGCPLIHVDAAIADEQGKMLPEGSEGELLIRGNHIFSGYWNNPRATRAAFLKGWVRTGDRGRCDGGFYYITE